MKTKFIKNRFRVSRYFVSSIILALCLVASQIGVSSVAQADNENIQIESEYAQAKITLDGKSPQGKKFKFKLLDSSENVLDTAYNDSNGDVKFKKILDKKDGRYTIELVKEDTENIEYKETSKTLDVTIKEVEKPGEVGPFDDAIGFVGNGVPRSSENEIKVDYWVGNNEKKTTKAYCINTDIYLQPNTNFSAITDPDDAELSKWILSKFKDCRNRCSTNKKEVRASGYKKRYGEFVRHEYEPKKDTVIEELKVLYGDNASNVLKKTVYYLDKLYSSDPKRLPQMRKKPYVNAQELVWASCGGYFGNLRGFWYKDYWRDKKYNKDTGRKEYQETLAKSDVSVHVQYLKDKLPKITVPENYHIIIFVSKGNTSQPLVFGYETHKVPNKKFKETWITVPQFEVTTRSKQNIIKVKKNDPEGNSLSGAVLQILNENASTVIKEWTSSNNEEDIEIYAGNYILREETAPKGYIKIKDVKFSVDKSGGITLNDTVEGVTVTASGSSNTFTINVKDEREEVKVPLNPSLKTTVTADNKSSSEVEPALVNKGKITVKDTISYTKFVKDGKYKVLGTLNRVFETKEEAEKVKSEEKTDKKVREIKGGDGKTYYTLEVKRSEVSVKTAGNDGSGTWTIDFGKTDVKAGAKYVVFEYVTSNPDKPNEAPKEDPNPDSPKGTDPKHEDPSDPSQTFNTKADKPKPSIITKFFTKLSENGEEIKTPEAINKIKLVDTVTYNNLEKGKEYRLELRVKEKAEDGSAKDILVNNKELGGFATFSAIEASGMVNVSISDADLSKFAEKTLVAYEKLFDADGKLIVSEENINNESQSIKVKPQAKKPRIGTKFVHIDGNSEEKLLTPTGSAILTDKVSYYNLTPGAVYSLKLTLMERTEEAGKVIGKALVVSDKAIEAVKEFKIDTEIQNTNKTTSVDGVVNVDVKVDLQTLAEKEIVAYEELYENGVIIAEHKDINDKEQTITFTKKPEIKTTFKDEKENKLIRPSETVKLVDRVDYKNLIPGKKYTLNLTVMDKSTNSPLLDEKGAPYKGTAEFTPKEKNGSESVEVTIDASKLVGKALVAFEELVQNGKTIAIHADIEDKEQTVEIGYKPEIGTQFADENGKKTFRKGDGEVTLVDTVAYKDLNSGKEYRLELTLMEKTAASTGTALMVSSAAVKASVTFSAITTSSEGSVKVPVKLNLAKLEGKKIVAFERLYEVESGNFIAGHEDINDEGQTIKVEETPKTPPTPPTTPSIPPVVPPTPPTTPSIPPVVPPTPPTTPSVPPVTPPTPPTTDIPEIPLNEFPNPNDPGSPDEFVAIDEDGTPQGRYVKKKKPNGKNEYILVEDKTPKGVPKAAPKKVMKLPQTGGSSPLLYYVGGGVVLLLAAGIVLTRKNRYR